MSDSHRDFNRFTCIADYAAHDGQIAYSTRIDGVPVVVLATGQALVTLDGDVWEDLPEHAIAGRLAIRGGSLVLEEIRDLSEAVAVADWVEKMESTETRSIIRNALVESGLLPNSSAA